MASSATAEDLRQQVREAEEQAHLASLAANEAEQNSDPSLPVLRQDQRRLEDEYVRLHAQLQRLEKEQREEQDRLDREQAATRDHILNRPTRTLSEPHASTASATASGDSGSAALDPTATSAHGSSTSATLPPGTSTTTTAGAAVGGAAAAASPAPGHPAPPPPPPPPPLRSTNASLGAAPKNVPAPTTSSGPTSASAATSSTAPLLTPTTSSASAPTPPTATSTASETTSSSAAGAPHSGAPPAPGATVYTTGAATSANGHLPPFSAPPSVSIPSIPSLAGMYPHLFPSVLPGAASASPLSGVAFAGSVPATPGLTAAAAAEQQAQLQIQTSALIKKTEGERHAVLLQHTVRRKARVFSDLVQAAEENYKALDADKPKGPALDLLVGRIKADLSDAEKRWQDLNGDKSRWDHAIYDQGLTPGEMDNQLNAVDAMFSALQEGPLSKMNAFLYKMRTREEDRVAQKRNLRPSAIKIDKFDGDLSLYFKFRKQFKDYYEVYAAVGDYAKFQHLKESLTGPPRAVIDTINFSDEAYELSWKRLDDRWGNRRAAANFLINKLNDFRLPAGASFAIMRSTHDTYHQNYLRLLELDPSYTGQDSALWSRLERLYSPKLKEDLNLMPTHDHPYPPIKEFLLKVDSWFSQQARWRNISDKPASGAGRDSHAKDGREKNKGRDPQKGSSSSVMVTQKHSSSGSASSGGARPKNQPSRGPANKQSSDKGKRGSGAKTFKPNAGQGKSGAGKESGPTPVCLMDSRHQHYITICEQYLALGPDARKAALVAKHACTRCCRLNHTFKDCTFFKSCGVKDKNGNRCGSTSHHYTIHGAAAFKPVTNKKQAGKG